jgi:hypothetical protein
MSGNFDQFLLGALLNIVSAVIIVRGIYYPWTQNRSYVFTYLAFNTTIYFVMAMLTSIELSVGVGFGLFAIFSVIRYRTEEMPIREMTYLFIVIAMPVINSIIASGGAWERVLIANGVVIAVLYVLEREWGFRFEVSKRVTYDRIELIHPDRMPDLVADLQARTGLAVTRVDVGRVDLLRDTAELNVFYDMPRTSGTAARRRGLQAEFQPAGRQLFEP